MAKVEREQLKKRFKQGMYPSEVDFANALDSYIHKDDKVPVSSVDGLAERINAKYDRTSGEQLEREHDRLATDFQAHESANEIQFNNITDSIMELTATDEAQQVQIGGLLEDIARQEHFRGYFTTNAEIQALTTPDTGDYAYSAESGTKWSYSGTAWADTSVPVPDQTVPASDATPLADGAATPGASSQYARGDHRHPTDTSRAADLEVAKLAVDNILTGNNTFAGTAAYADPDYYPAFPEEFVPRGFMDRALQHLDDKVSPKLQSLRLHATMSPDTITVDEIARVRCFNYYGEPAGSTPANQAVMISLNRPPNYTFFTKSPIWYALAEVKWNDATGANGGTNITSVSGINKDTATFSVTQSIYPDIPYNSLFNLNVDIYTPVVAGVDNAIYFALPGSKEHDAVANVLEYDSAGATINNLTIGQYEAGSAHLPGHVAIKLNASTAAIRVQFEATGIRMNHFAIYANPTLSWRYSGEAPIGGSGVYAMTRAGNYEPVKLPKVPRIMDKAGKLIATPIRMAASLGESKKYTISRYIPPVSDYAEVLYGKVVSNPLGAIRVVGAANLPIGVFVRLKLHRPESKLAQASNGHDTRTGTNRNDGKWTLYTGYRNKLNTDGSPIENPFPAAGESYIISNGLYNYFKKAFILNGTLEKGIMYMECLLAFVYTTPKGAQNRPLGKGVRFRIRNRKSRGAVGPDGGREWVVERA